MEEKEYVELARNKNKIFRDMQGNTYVVCNSENKPIHRINFDYGITNKDLLEILKFRLKSDKKTVRYLEEIIGGLL